jgi:Ni/Fe-hydrogenase subunit HybB-like protein
MTSEALPRPTPGTEASRLLAIAEGRHAPSTLAFGAATTCAVLGLACAIIGLIRAPTASWGAVAANLLFWSGLAQGGVVVAASFHLAEARWGRLVERFALAQGAFLPISVVLVLALRLGRAHLFPWYGQRALSPWLNANALVLRDAAALLVMTLLSGAFARASLRHGGSTRRLAIAATVLFFPAFGMLAVDLGMTPDLRYHSTVYPVLYLAGCYYTALAATALAVALWRRGEPRKRLIGPKRLLDLGNLLWAFAIFLGYLWWCEFLVVWMGNLPDEAGRHLHQWRDWPWRAIAWTSLICGVALPSAILLGRGLKKSALILGAAGAIALLGVLLERILDVLPALPVERGIGTALLVTGITIGFAGLFALCYLAAFRRIPLFPTEDPQFLKELATRDVKA